VPDRVLHPNVDRESSRAGGEAPTELIRGLAVFAEPPGEEHELLSKLFDFPSCPSASEYSDVFLFQLYPYGSVHLGSEGMLGGEARDRIAGFWSAVGRVPPAEPDHLAALLGLYVELAEAEIELHGAERELSVQSRRALLLEHLAPWVFAFLHRIDELTSGVYSAWASLLGDVLREEVIAATPNGQGLMPLHLRVAEAFPDPRVDGAPQFLGAILSPIRSGMIVTRADLARISGELALGLRAGERRYALEHLLAQEPISVLRALAEEAARQGEMHRAREPWLGDVASFMADRAGTTATLLLELAEEGASSLELHTQEHLSPEPAQ
jgi:hypothetical protein